MTRYVAFLRAVNIGRRKYPMAELRAALTDAGFTGVETHIQTGNVLVETRMRSADKVAATLEEVMLADRGFEVPVVLFTPRELPALVAEAEEYAGAGAHVAHYLTLLRDEPDPALREQLESRSLPDEVLRVGRRAVHLVLDKPYHEVTMTNAAVERVVGVATTRNLTVVRTLAEKWGP